jgi:hypothetical protein
MLKSTFSKDNIQIYNAKYWQKIRDFIGLYHFEVIIQLWA